MKILNVPLLKDAFPPESAPRGKAPVGVSPLSCRTDSDSSLEKIALTLSLYMLISTSISILEKILILSPQNREDTSHFSNRTNLITNDFFTFTSLA